jgi:hypothetical protein
MISFRVFAHGDLHIAGSAHLQWFTRLVATWVKFKGDDLEQAQVAEAAHRQNRKQTAENKAKLERRATALKEQNEQL